MLQPALSEPLSLNRPTVAPQHATQAPPYSPTLINLNQRYNMSANSLTEALLLLSGMYISLVQPDPGPVKVGLHAIFPKTSGPFMQAITDPFKPENKWRTTQKYPGLPGAFNISSSYTRSDYAPKEVLDMLCEQVFPNNTITMIYLNNHLGLSKYNRPAVSYLPKVIESLGLPVISYDTQFSPSSQPNLSIQLAPTMGQMMDVMFAFLRRFGWTDFSFLCTLSYGCQDEIAYIKLKIEEARRKTKLSVYGVEMFSYKLLSYVNFTNGANKTEAREKLMYELHKDSRIALVHGSGPEVKTIMDVAATLGLTGQDYVWIFTSASISLFASIVDPSYPLGSFVIAFDSGRNIMTDVMKSVVNLWLDALNSLATSSEMDSMDFATGFSCDRLKGEMAPGTNDTWKPSLFWKYGEVLYRYLLKSKLNGDLEFDEYGVLKANKFFIMNVQLQVNNSTMKEETSGKKPIGGSLTRGGSDSSRGSRRLTFPLPSRPSFSPSEWDDNDQDLPLSSGRESGLPSTRDGDHGLPSRKDSSPSITREKETVSPFSRDRESGSPFSRDRESGSSPFSKTKDLDTGTLSSRNRDTGFSYSRNKQTGSPLSRNADLDSGRSRFGSSGSVSKPDASKEQDPSIGNDDFTDAASRSSLLMDGNFGSSVSARRNSSLPKESQVSMGKERRSLLEFNKNAHDSALHSGNSSPSFSYDKSYYKSNINGTSSYLDPSIMPVFPDDSGLTSEIISPNKESKFRSSRSISAGDESLSNQRRSRRGRENRYQRSMIKLNSRRRFHVGKDTADLENDSNHKNSTNDQKGQAKGRHARAVSGLQIAARIGDWDGHKLMIYDITWPGGASKPPKGKPEKYILKAVTWQEDPHVIYREMKTELNEVSVCEANSVPCTVYNRDKSLQRTNGTKQMCCTGLCIDLLKRLGEMLNFDVELSEVADGSYGSPLNANLTDWNGMLGMLIQKEADLAIGALSITPERSAAVDFSVPFLQTGITIIVALRHGVISATAFLEPYDYPSWSLILLFSVHATGASIFIFEWLSPYGLDQGKTSFSVHKFSLFRSFWLIWAMLFGASVSTDQPRGIASRFLANIWALFAVVFCASYTANLAAFMITKDTYYDLSGIQDWRLRNPHHVKPSFKFATIANSSTDLNIKKNYKDIHQYMKSEAQTDVKDAIKNLKSGKIQAFIYDSTTLEYEVGKDDGCKLKTVGKRIAETGYGVAFPKRSVWVKEVDRALLQLQESGEIERLQKHWLARACHNKKETGVSSHTLGILNFTSAFVLLGSGVVLGVLILVLEHMYFRFGRKSLKKWDKCGCCSLVSLSMGQSLTFEQSVMEAIDYHKHHRCRDPLCETQLWKVKHDLDIALLKISQLRKQIATSVSLDYARGGDYGASSKYVRESSPRQNGTARKRRQQTSDADSDKMDRSANQPLLALEGKSETDDDNSPVHSPKHRGSPFSSRASLPVGKDKPRPKDSNSGRYSYSEQSPRLQKRRDSEEKPPTRLISAPQYQRTPAEMERGVTSQDFKSLPPTFDEAMRRGFIPSPTDELSPSPSPHLPPPPLSPPPPAEPSPPHHGRDSALSDTASSNSPSSDDKRYEPFILDSPESPSFSSFSETSDNRLSGPGTLSKLSDEVPSTALSQDMDSNFNSSPDISRSLDDPNALPNLGYSNNQYTSPQNKHLASPMEGVVPSILPEDGKQDTQLLVLHQSKEDDNDVNTRRNASKDSNIYVNVDEIGGKETAF